MPPWNALNIEPDSDIEEDEYDDTKEIQIEDALKLYQNALKLHSQGPSRFDEAEEAYTALFDSEIFSYPESQSELRRVVTINSAEDSDYENATTIPGGILPTGSESAPNTLPQILHLSCKNRGRFLLDRLVYQLTLLHQKGVHATSDEEQQASRIAEQSLRLLNDALDKDETDDELWRRVSKICNYLSTLRIARFALESSTADEEKNDSSLLEGANLNALIVQEELKDLLKGIQADADGLENLRLMSGWNAPAKVLFTRLDPLNILKTSLPSRTLQYPSSNAHEIIPVSEETWQDVGEAIFRMRKLQIEEGGLEPGTRFSISLPGDENRALAGKSAAAEVLSKSRLSLSPTTPIGKPSFDQVLGSARQSTSPTFQKRDLPSVPNGNSSVTGRSNPANESTADVKIGEPSSSTPGPKTASEARLSLKRGSELAGLQDTPEGGRGRSKRLRARAETLAEETAEQKVLNKHHEQQMQQYATADEWLFSVAREIGLRMDVDALGSMEALRELASAESQNHSGTTKSPDPLSFALRDFKSSLHSWTSNKSNLLLNGTGPGASAVLIDNGADSGFTAFMEHAKAGSKRLDAVPDSLTKQGLSQFTSSFASDSHDIERMLISWVQALLKPHRVPGSRRNMKNWLTSSYTRYAWSAELKELLTNILIVEDEAVNAFIKDALSIPQDSNKSSASATQLHEDDLSLIEFVQTIFELHLNTYGKMVSSDSKVDQPSRAAQRDRINRWANLASNVLGQPRLHKDTGKKAKQLVLRHLWSYVVFIGLVEISARDHLLLCYQELKDLLEMEGSPVYLLPNNSIMPEVSADALEREMSKEKTMDFFQSIFGSESQDPASLIESLEPILMGNATVNDKAEDSLNEVGDMEIADSQQDDEDTQRSDLLDANDPGPQPLTHTNQQLLEFMHKATAQLRLSLWHQLKMAYDRINYPAMKVVCNFRSMDIILEELQSPEYISDKSEGRSANLIIWIRNLSDLTSQCLEWMKTSSQALECLDEGNLELSLRTCSQVVRLFHTFALWEDAARVQQLQQPSQAPTTSPPHKGAMNFLRDMQPRVWQLLYILYREAASQEHDSFPNLREDLVEYLRAVHNAFGLREYCRVGRKSFLKFLKSELIRLDAPEEDISQVLYDLYGLKITQNSSQLLDHGCTGDQIDRASALEIVGFVVEQAKNMNMKDVLKSDLKLATEKMQAVIGTPRASSVQQLSNRRNVTHYLKQPIVPTNLFKALRGLQGLTGQRVDTQYATVASKKWFFLVGQINLAKYRLVRRTAPDNSDDLENAVTFLKLDLDFDTESWETWLRLGQAYDAKIEEDIIWQATAINERPSELMLMQRNSIHCYEMAASLAMQFADGSIETRAKLAELYLDFANRIYASTRAPFDMKAFDTVGHERYVNQPQVGTYKIQAFVPLSPEKAWKLAGNLYQKVLTERPDDWFVWYMLGKCRWKLLRYINANAKDSVYCIDAFIRAIKCVPEKRDSRHPEKEPILDPHYKLVSVVYKLLRDGHLRPDEGINILGISHYTRKANYESHEAWERYILDVLQVLRNADKANWHHRIVSRIAHIEFSKNPNSLAAAQAAKDKFTQHILTKSMGIQVWKPEFERAGRHFVYTSRYLRFIILLLKRLGERSTLEALGRRIRKRQNEFIEHTEIWMDLCQAHIQLLRQQENVPEGSEERVFRIPMSLASFTLNANRLESWGHSQLSLTNTKLPLLSEALELKKLNGSLLDKALFEDLVSDIYSLIYEAVVPELIARAGEAENRERMRIDRMLMNSESNEQSGQATSAGDTPNQSNRIKTISRTEIRRRAEALAARPSPTTGRGKISTAVEVRIEREPSQRERSTVLEETAVGAFSPHSRHDTADDESDLSSVGNSEDLLTDPDLIPEELQHEEELDDEPGEPEGPPVMFPGLKAKEPKTEAASRNSTVSAESNDKMEGMMHD